MVLVTNFLPVVCVEYFHLLLTGFDDVGMAMADVTDVVNAIEELVAIFIVHVLTYLTANV